MFSDLYDEIAHKIYYLHKEGKSRSEIVNYFVDLGYSREFVSPIVSGIIGNTIPECS